MSIGSGPLLTVRVTVSPMTSGSAGIGAFFGGYWGTNNQGSSSFFDLKTYNGPAIRNQRGGIPADAGRPKDPSKLVHAWKVYLGILVVVPVLGASLVELLEHAEFLAAMTHDLDKAGHQPRRPTSQAAVLPPGSTAGLA